MSSPQTKQRISGFNIVCLLAAAAVGTWPLLAYWNRVVNLGASGLGSLRFVLDFNYVLLIPALGVLSLFVGLFLSKSQTRFRIFASAAFHVFVGCIIAYGFLHLFASNVNWRESHIRVNDPFAWLKK